MKKNIHPEYMDSKVTCACGNTFTVQSNREEIHVEVCNKCHPAYTGKNSQSGKRAGNIEKFNKKYGRKQEEN
ncbi:MAG: 50S ribosomal protein L31 [Firmicutes bacterium]|nr:50S ribosomal protein L31 [Bacillota bacterium]